MTIKEKLDRAEVALTLDEPFWGCLLGRLQLVKDDTIRPKTMCTDGKRIRFHPEFVEKLEVGEIKTVLIHEIFHCAFLHHTRRGYRNPRKWNIATDYSINNELVTLNAAAKAAGRVEPYPFPTEKGKINALIDPQFNGMLEEAIYDKLPDPEDDGGGDDDESGGGMGEVEDGGATPEELKEMAEDWKESVIMAANLAKKQGKLPARIERMVDELINPPPRWQDLLRNFARELCKDDYSWKVSNRRYLHTGFYLPALRSERLGAIAVAIDTSGSVDGPLLATFIAEVEGLCREVKPAKIILMDCDATLHSIREFGPLDVLPRDFKGGGGTSFVPPIEAMKDEDICAFIYLTDLYGDFPEEPKFPVFWATITEDKEAPFGVTVPIK